MSHLTIDGCYFQNNTGSSGTIINISRCTNSTNRSIGGGVIYIDGPANDYISIYNSSFISNTATYGIILFISLMYIIMFITKAVLLFLKRHQM